MDFSTIKNTSKKERGNNMNFSTSQLHRKKYVETISIFRPSKIHWKKYVKTTSTFRPVKLRQKNYVETTWIFRSAKLHPKSTRKWRWKFVQICSLTNRRNIDVESISIRGGVPVGNTFQCFMAFPLWNPFPRLCDLGNLNYSSLILKNDRLSLYNTIYIFLKFIRAICKWTT